MVVLVLLTSGCGNKADHQTLAVAESFAIADLEIESAARVRRTANAGRPTAAFPSYATISQIYQAEGDPDPVENELRERAVEDGWVIEEVYGEGGWRSAVRVVADRPFRVRTGFNPEANQVQLWIDELPPEISE